jgi:L-cysteine desulfidase
MDNSRFLKALKSELVVALGCTEPIAIAFTAAMARKHVKGDIITEVKVSASGNVIKNAMAVSIPGADGTGINLAAALGSLAKDVDRNLEILSGLSREDVLKAKDMIRDDIVSIDLAPTSKKLYIQVIVKTESSYAKVVVEDKHTHVSLIEVDGAILEKDSSDRKDADCDMDYGLDIDSIWDFIQDADLEELGIVRDSIELNRAIGVEGLNNEYGLQVGRTILKRMDKSFLADDMTNYAMALTSAGSDARMAGCVMKVMSNSGSGNQGITATLPVVAVWEGMNRIEKHMNSEVEALVRATALSHLISIHMKSKFGRLSALCGATIAGTGASCGIVYLMGGDRQKVKSAVQNMLGNVTGMLCDGAKAGCALKVSTCTNAAVHSAIMAMEGIEIKSTDGIIEDDPEKTIENLCRLGNHGTLEADRIILEIMVGKAAC